MAQFGSAPDWGSGGRRFKSCRPDHSGATGNGPDRRLTATGNPKSKVIISGGAGRRRGGIHGPTTVHRLPTTGSARVPNLLSVLRLLGVPLFLWLLLGPQPTAGALLVLALSGLTDWADGVLARRLNQRQPAGRAAGPARGPALHPGHPGRPGAAGHHPAGGWRCVIDRPGPGAARARSPALRRRGSDRAAGALPGQGRPPSTCSTPSRCCCSARITGDQRAWPGRSPGRSRSGGPGSTCGPAGCTCCRSAGSPAAGDRPMTAGTGMDPPAVAACSTTCSTTRSTRVTGRPRPGGAADRDRRGGDRWSARCGVGCLLIGLLLVVAYQQTHRTAPAAATRPAGADRPDQRAPSRADDQLAATGPSAGRRGGRPARRASCRPGATGPSSTAELRAGSAGGHRTGHADRARRSAAECPRRAPTAGPARRPADTAVLTRPGHAGGGQRAVVDGRRGDRGERPAGDPDVGDPVRRRGDPASTSSRSTRRTRSGDR